MTLDDIHINSMDYMLINKWSVEHSMIITITMHGRFISHCCAIPVHVHTIREATCTYHNIVSKSGKPYCNSSYQGPWHDPIQLLYLVYALIYFHRKKATNSA